MNNLTRFVVARQSQSFALRSLRLVHNSNISSADRQKYRTVNSIELTTMSTSDAILKHNINYIIRMSQQFEKNLNGISILYTLIV